MDPQRPLDVLVTGGSGFVGAAVLAELIRRGHRVVATTTGPTAARPAAPGLRWVTWDATREPLPAVDWDDLRTILHLAAPAELFAPERASAIFEVTVAATFRLLEAARARGVGRLLVASTGDVLGSSPGPAREDDVTYRPSSFYGAAKACAELLLRGYPAPLSTAILRLYHPYGPGGERFLINRVVRRVAEGQEVRIEGPDGILLNPVWIEDLAAGVALAVESGATGIFHLAGPEVVSLRGLLEIIGELIGRRPVIRAEGRPCNQRHAGSSEAACRILGYSPRVSLRDGLDRLWAGRPASPGRTRRGSPAIARAIDCRARLQKVSREPTLFGPQISEVCDN